ncbi:MAG: hypothetical protein HY300_09025, partial [Verrucomicrobia bacterium]|nr:hypothetical protein [Verrucomicrobiota bacterium]
LFVEGMDTILATQRRVAEMYFEDGGIMLACPPLRALLHIMRDGHFEGRGLEHAEIRTLFTRDAMLASDWYAQRLTAKQNTDVRLWRRHVAELEHFLAKANYAEESERLGLAARLIQARRMLEQVKSPDYVNQLRGTLGVNPLG